MVDLSGRVAIVTGGSRGVGALIAERLALSGAHVILGFAKSTASAKDVVDRIGAAGGRAVAVQANLLDVAQAGSLASAAIKTFGRLDVMVNAAAIARAGALDTVTPLCVAEHHDLNVRGRLLTSQAAARVMGAGAVIINVSQSPPGAALAELHAYAMTVGAVDALTRSMGAELEPRGIRVVGVKVGLMASLGAAGAGEAHLGMLETHLRREETPADMAGVVAYLASDEAAGMTAATIEMAGDPPS